MAFKDSKTPDAPPAPEEGPSASYRKPIQHSIIGAGVVITGDLVSTGDITVDGTVDGNITCRTLTLGEKPVVNSTISADTVRVCGEFHGKITAQKVVLTRHAKVTGDIEQGSLEIEPGAQLEGTIRRLGTGKANGTANGAG